MGTSFFVLLYFNKHIFRNSGSKAKEPDNRNNVFPRIKIFSSIYIFPKTQNGSPKQTVNRY